MAALDFAKSIIPGAASDEDIGRTDRETMGCESEVLGRRAVVAWLPGTDNFGALGP